MRDPPPQTPSGLLQDTIVCYKSETLRRCFLSSAAVSSKDWSSVHGDPLMDLSVTQRFLQPRPDSAMLAPRPPFFLGPLTSQNCSQLTQQHLQVGKEKREVGPVNLKSNITCTGREWGVCFVWRRKGRRSTSAPYLRFNSRAQLLCRFRWNNQS